MLTQPKQLAIGLAGALVLNIATGLGFWAALLAFGHATNPVETTFVFLLANAPGSAVPTPGGLGAVEAALTFAFTSVGVPPARPCRPRWSTVWRSTGCASRWAPRHEMVGPAQSDLKLCPFCAKYGENP